MGVIRKLPQDILRLRQEPKRPTPFGCCVECVCQDPCRQDFVVEQI